MDRAERRRLKRENSKKDNIYTLTQEQIDEIRKDAFKEAIDKAFLKMLAIPIEILATKHWKKSAATRIPEFIDDCIELYEDIGRDKVDLEQLVKTTERLGKIKMCELREVYK